MQETKGIDFCVCAKIVFTNITHINDISLSMISNPA